MPTSPRPPEALPPQVQEIERTLLRLAGQGTLPVPPFPAVALRVQRLVASHDTGLREIARVISSDAALTADVLRCANSALVSRGVPVRDLTQAITRIGADEITRITLSSALSAQALDGGGLAPLKRAIWIESLAGAVLCQELAKLRRLGRDGAAFVAGLLHDFGRVVAVTRIESILAAAPDVPALPMEDWAALVERLHVPVGVLLASRWALPLLVRQVVALHHGQTSQGCENPDLLEVVRIRDQIVDLLARAPCVDATDLATVPGLDGREEQQAVARVIERIPPFIAAFEGASVDQVVPRTWVTAPHSALAAGERPVDLDVTLFSGGTQRRYKALVLAPNGLLLVGTEPVAQNHLLRAVIEGAGLPIELWAVPRLVQRRSDHHRIELQPYGLGGEVRVRWRQLYELRAPA
ncbi:MAG: HDOD domain-containing protein [Anaeromyxobacter sp.]